MAATAGDDLEGSSNDAAAVFIPALFKPAALLPIAKYREELLYTIATHAVTVVIGATGSGKSTQLPQFLEQAGWCSDGKVIAVTQPRRVAATSVAIRVAEEVRCSIGQEVGYSIRFEDMTSAKTRIKFLTDGMLLREALVDPLLSRYSVIMVDEAHERSLSSDVLLGLLKKILRRRPHDLRIVVSSATLQADEFASFFDLSTTTTTTATTTTSTTTTTTTSDHTPPAPAAPASPGSVTNKKLNSDVPQKRQDAAAATADIKATAIFNLPGRMYPVDIHYLEEPTEDYIERAVATIFDIHQQEPTGDILVFLTGREEIDTVAQMIADRALDLHPHAQKMRPVPLYAGLPSDEQMAVFEPAPENTRKVVVATNIAEASVTIDGVVYVIDCGFAKLRAFDPNTGIETLTAVPVSKASAVQRAGRAGRTKPGKCYRLYTTADHSKLPATTVPEIQRSNLAPTVLQLKALGIDNVARFDFLTSPPAELMIRALDLLYSLGALDDYAKLTKPLGLRMAELALEPMMAKALLSALDFGCLSEMLSIAAMTGVHGGSSTVWFSHEGERSAMETCRRKFAAEEGDHLTLLNAYQAFVSKGRKDARWCRDNHLNYKTMTRAVSARNQLKRYLERFGVSVDESLSAAPATADGQSMGEKIRRCLTTGFFAQAARMQPDGSFRTVSGGTTMYAHPSSLMFNRKADWVIFQEVMETSNKTYIRDISKIQKSWLLEYAPTFYQTKT